MRKEKGKKGRSMEAKRKERQRRMDNERSGKWMRGRGELKKRNKE